MKRRVLNLRMLFTMIAVLACANAANPQRDRRLPDLPIQAGTVTEKSPLVDLKTAGKEVAPGVFEIDPASISGKRLGLPRGGQALRTVCIGQWKKGECRGILIEW